VKVFAGVAGAMAVISLAASSKSRRASAGFLPSSTSTPTPGAWYQSRRSDLLMGRGPRSITWRRRGRPSHYHSAAKCGAASSCERSPALRRTRSDARRKARAFSLDPSPQTRIRSGYTCLAFKK